MDLLPGADDLQAPSNLVEALLYTFKMYYRVVLRKLFLDMRVTIGNRAVSYTRATNLRVMF